MYQVVEKSLGTDWSLVRYHERSLSRFDSEQEANKVAIEYLTDRNCNNALTASEKLANIECFMMNEEGCFLGVLDGKDWYLTYPKNTKKGDVEHSKGDIIRDRKFFLLEGKTEVAVRTLPGT